MHGVDSRQRLSVARELEKRATYKRTYSGCNRPTSQLTGKALNRGRTDHFKNNTILNCDL